MEISWPTSQFACILRIWPQNLLSMIFMKLGTPEIRISLVLQKSPCTLGTFTNKEQLCFITYFKWRTSLGSFWCPTKKTPKVISQSWRPTEPFSLHRCEYDGARERREENELPSLSVTPDSQAPQKQFSPFSQEKQRPLVSQGRKCQDPGKARLRSGSTSWGKERTLLHMKKSVTSRKMINYGCDKCPW